MGSNPTSPTIFQQTQDGRPEGSRKAIKFGLVGKKPEEVKMAERSKDWYNQSKRDLASAKSQLEAEFFEWAAFIAHQAAEKAAKAVYQKFAAEAWGHSLNDLLTGLKEKAEVSDSLIDKAKQLDKYYIPARYPNGWAEGFPGQYITRKDAEDAISDSEEILRFCEGLLAE